MDEDDMQEMLEIVAELSRKYASGDRTSITYETAEQLMGAVQYCINEYESEDSTCRDDAGDRIESAEIDESARKKSLTRLPESGSLSVRARYDAGRRILSQKVRTSLNSYNSLMEHFDAYGNHNLNDVVTKAIPGFFKYYDHRYYPQNTIITCDYPTIIPPFISIEKEVKSHRRDDREEEMNSETYTGIDAISRYICYITIEQSFIGRMPRDFVIRILKVNDASYEHQFYNISSILIYHVLGCLFIGKKLTEEFSQPDYEELYMKIKGMKSRQSVRDKQGESAHGSNAKESDADMKNGEESDVLVTVMKSLLRDMVSHIYEGFPGMYEYFSPEAESFARRLNNVSEVRYLRNVLV